MPDDSGKRSNVYRLSGVGFEFGGAVIGFTLIGYWVGSHYEKQQAGVLIGAGLGIVGGGYNLIRQALAETKRAANEQKAHRDKDDPDSRNAP